MKMKTTSFRFDKRTDDVITELAKQLNLKRVQVIKLAVAKLQKDLILGVLQELDKMKVER